MMHRKKIIIFVICLLSVVLLIPALGFAIEITTQQTITYYFQGQVGSPLAEVVETVYVPGDDVSGSPLKTDLGNYLYHFTIANISPYDDETFQSPYYELDMFTFQVPLDVTVAVELGIAPAAGPTPDIDENSDSIMVTNLSLLSFDNVDGTSVENWGFNHGLITFWVESPYGPGNPGVVTSSVSGVGWTDENNTPMLWGPIEPPQPVPEPATLLLIGSGLIGLAMFRKIRRKRDSA